MLSWIFIKKGFADITTSLFERQEKNNLIILLLIQWFCVVKE